MADINKIIRELWRNTYKGNGQPSNIIRSYFVFLLFGILIQEHFETLWWSSVMIFIQYLVHILCI